ncbi:MAG: outer membrane beta-barrel protein [Bacteroidota bacterium]|jgi:opacity protein-like surface antigen
MSRLIKLCLFFVFCASSVKVIAQTLPNKTLYTHASAGLARSEDGLKFMVKESASQWTPKANLGIGYRFNKYLGIETHAATMLTSLKANGTLVLNNEKAEVTAIHSNVMISPKFYLPLGDKSEIFLRTGLGILISQSEINSPSNPDLKKSTSNIGYMVSLGYAHKLTDKVVFTLQFDFSDPYGSKDVWEGDLGLLNAGIKYSLNNKK